MKKNMAVGSRAAAYTASISAKANARGVLLLCIIYGGARNLHTICVCVRIQESREK